MCEGGGENPDGSDICEVMGTNPDACGKGTNPDEVGTLCLGPRIDG